MNNGTEWNSPNKQQIILSARVQADSNTQGEQDIDMGKGGVMRIYINNSDIKTGYNTKDQTILSEYSLKIK